MTVAKALAAALAAVLAAVLPALVLGPLGFTGWANVVILGAGAIQVYNTSNAIPGWPYAKLAAATVSAAAVATLSALSDGPITRVEWAQILIAALSAFAVYRLPNTSPALRGGRHALQE